MEHMEETNGEWFYTEETRKAALSQYGCTCDSCCAAIPVERKDRTMSKEQDRVTQTIDRLVSNLPRAIIKLKNLGLTSLSRQIQNDLENLVSWQDEGGLASMYKAQHQADTSRFARLVCQNIKPEYDNRDRCECDQINWTKGPHHQEACPMWEKTSPEHHLKTWPPYFEEILTGNKTFDLRENDRGFNEGDILVFEEWDPETGLYSGRQAKMKVGFMIQGEWGLSHSTCAMALLKVGADDEN